jgi:hypothetical protein
MSRQGDRMSSRWLAAPLDEVAAASPQVALCRVLRIPLQPRLLSIRATFNDTTTVVGPYTWAITGGSTGAIIEPTRLDQFAIVDSMVFNIDQPNANSGSQFKPETDYYFRYQSGIAATMIVDGAPRYTPSADYTPIDLLCAMMNEAWAYGWVLGYTQSVKMQFLPSVLITPPTTVTVTFRMWQALQNTQDFVGLTDSRAIEMLQQNGYKFPVGPARA